MDASSVLSQLEAACAKVFHRGAVQLTPTTSAADVDGWDSLSHVQLLLEVEKVFAIKFSFREVMRLANVGELACLIERKVKQKTAA